MPAIALDRRSVAKPWGRRDVPDAFGPLPADGEPLGEVWFEEAGGAAAELLVKYLFTSERLSIQVHPGDADARAAGHARGKDEAWVVLDAEPDAVIGLGLVEPVSRQALRAAALDGSIERLIDWRAARAGDTIYSPAGTVHAIGGGLTLVEIQQNLDLTYRLYDYGRPRALHLDEAVAVADPSPYVRPFEPRRLGEGRDLIAAGAFMLERWRAREQRVGTDGDDPVWLIPLAGAGLADGSPIEPGTVWIARGPTSVRAPEQGELLVAYAGDRVRRWD